MTLVSVLIFVALISVGGAWVHRLYWRTMSRSPRQWLRALVGLGHGVDELAIRLGLSAQTLRSHVPSYREFRRKKRGGGERLIVAPEAETKKLQRTIHRRLLGKLKIHPNALGFRRGQSIVTHAQVHAGQKVVVRLDVIDFFSSTGAKRIEQYFRRIGWGREAAALLTKLTTYKGGLPQGAPTSPLLSNLVNYSLDVHLTSYVRRLELKYPGSVNYAPLKARYSRYADDITFSLSREARPRFRRRGFVVRGLINRTRRSLKVFGYRLHTQKKLLVRRQHQRQIVTGLVVNSVPNIPRETRRKLRAARHHLANGKPATFTENELRGWEAFQRMVEKQRKPIDPPAAPFPKKPKKASRFES